MTDYETFICTASRVISIVNSED